MRPDIPAKPRFAPLFVLVVGILAIFLGRALLSARFVMPLTSHLFETLTIAGSLLVLSKSHSVLRREDGWIALSLGLAISLVGEEMTYRTLIQGRLTPFVGIPAAVGMASLLFGLAHFTPGPGWVVLTDVGLIVVDSILYGVMFARRGNLWVVWLAHLLGDVLGLAVLASI